MAYAYYRPVVIDHTKVPNTNQTNFPVLISGTYSYLATVANGGKVQHASGYDIAFYSDSALTTQLDHEVERWVSTTGVFVAWVRIPSLLTASDTTIYLAYGNSAISSSQQNVAGTWNSNFKAVYHFGDGSSLSVTDSTGLTSPTNHSATATASGKVYGGANFNGTSHYIDTGTNIGPFGHTSSFTVEAWINSALDATHRVVVGNTFTTAGWHLRMNTTDIPRFILVQSAGATFKYADCKSSALSSGLHYVVGSYGGSGATPKGYADAVDPAVNGTSGTLTDITTGAGNVFIGLDTVADAHYFKTVIDEVRISNVERSADWITTTYNTINAPGTFYSIGSEVASTIVATPTTAALVLTTYAPSVYRSATSSTILVEVAGTDRT